MQETWVQSLGQEDPLEKEMATHSSILAGESHGQRSLVGCHPRGCKVRHDWATSLSFFLFNTFSSLVGRDWPDFLQSNLNYKAFISCSYYVPMEGREGRSPHWSHSVTLGTGQPLSEVLLLLMVRGKRELWVVSNQQMRALSLKVALINVPATLWTPVICPTHTQRSQQSSPRRGRIPMQFQEGPIWLGWQSQDTTCQSTQNTVIASIEDRIIHKLWPCSSGDV